MDDGPKIPFIGGWRAKITRIEKMWMQPCAINPVLAVVGAFAASPALVYGLVKPDCLDNTFDRVGRRHGKRRRSRFDPTHIATPLPVPSGYVGTALFRGAKFAQAVGWWATVIDGALDTVVYGTSFAFQLSGCKDPNQGFGECEMDHTVAELYPASTSIIRTWSRITDHIFRAGPTGVACPKGHQPGVSCSLQQHVGLFPPLPDCSFTWKVTNRFGKGISDDVPVYTLPGGDRVSYYENMVFGDSQEKNDVAIVLTKTEGVLCLSGHLTVTGLNLEGMETDFCSRKAIESPFAGLIG